MKTSSKINVCNVIREHLGTLKYDNGRYIKKDKKFFFVYPIVIAIIAIILIGQPNEQSINIFAICLSIFVGLFLNLLVLIISFAENKSKVKDISNRSILIAQTFYNISYTIIISLISLGFLFLLNLDFFPNKWGFKVNSVFSLISNKDNCIYFNDILKCVFSLIFYAVFIQVIFTLLMIIKRIFKLFDVELKYIKRNEQEQNKKKD